MLDIMCLISLGWVGAVSAGFPSICCMEEGNGIMPISQQSKLRHTEPNLPGVTKGGDGLARKRPRSLESQTMRSHSQGISQQRTPQVGHGVW